MIYSTAIKKGVARAVRFLQFNFVSIFILKIVRARDTIVSELLPAAHVDRKTVISTTLVKEISVKSGFFASVLYHNMIRA